MNLHELNERRCATRRTLEYLGQCNRPVDSDERLRSDARYALAQDVWMRAERAYQSALSGISTDQLMTMANEK